MELDSDALGPHEQPWHGGVARPFESDIFNRSFDMDENLRAGVLVRPRHREVRFDTGRSQMESKGRLKETNRTGVLLTHSRCGTPP